MTQTTEHKKITPGDEEFWSERGIDFHVRLARPYVRYYPDDTGRYDARARRVRHAADGRAEGHDVPPRGAGRRHPHQPARRPPRPPPRPGGDAARHGDPDGLDDATLARLRRSAGGREALREARPRLPCGYLPSVEAPRQREHRGGPRARGQGQVHLPSETDREDQAAGA